MRRRGIILALGAALLALPSGAHGAQQRSACQKLTAKHDLAPAKKVKLVRRKNDEDGYDLVGCVLPRGHLVTVAIDGPTGSGGDSYDLRQVAGHHVLVHIDSSSPSASYDATEVVDLKRGKRYQVAWRCLTPSTCEDEGDWAKRALINSSGQAAAVVKSQSSDLVSVEGFSSRGRKVVFDSGTRNEIPASSLELDRHVASWTHNGAPKSARLPTVSQCEKLRARPDLAGARRVKLAERKNEDNGTDLVGCVLPRGKVSVVASSGKQSGLERKYRVLQVAAHQVLVRGDVINPYGHGVSTYVYDLKRLTSYTIAETCFDSKGAPCEPQTVAKRAFVNPQGQAAAIVADQGSSDVRVLGFKSTGERAVLDSGSPQEIPASSLRLDGHVVRWTHAGAPRSATLSG